MKKESKSVIIAALLALVVCTAYLVRNIIDYKQRLWELKNKFKKRKYTQVSKKPLERNYITLRSNN